MHLDYLSGDAISPSTSFYSMNPMRQHRIKLIRAVFNIGFEQVFCLRWPDENKVGLRPSSGPGLKKEGKEPLEDFKRVSSPNDQHREGEGGGVLEATNTASPIRSPFYLCGWGP